MKQKKFAAPDDGKQFRLPFEENVFVGKKFARSINFTLESVRYIKTSHFADPH